MFLLDANICIYYLKGMFPQLRERLLAEKPRNIKIPAVVYGELMLGVEKSQRRKQNLSRVRAFLEPFEILPFDTAAGDAYAVLRASLEKKGQMIGPNDCLIAASALAYHATLVSHNLKEFKRIPKLKLVDWTS